MSEKETNVIDAQSKFEGLRTMVSDLMGRFHLANRAGVQFGGDRKLYEVFGYKTVLTPEDFLAKYARQDIASRVIDAPPGATWSNPPTIKEDGDIKNKWEEIAKQTKLWGAMHRADRLARLNTFSLLLFGFDDGTAIKRPVRKASKLLFVRAVGARQVRELTFDTNTKSPRFGLPEVYKIKFDDPTSKVISESGVNVKNMKDIVVHHSRVIHVVENPLEDIAFGIPIIEKCFNLLDDLLKVCGGTAEMYWLAGNRGIQANIDKDMDVDPADAAALAEEIDEYMHQLRRFIKTRGVELKVLDSSTPNPKEVFEMIVALLSGTTGIPRRILLGSEAGQLASEQDRANWAERIQERRALFATPNMLEPAMELLQIVGLIPEGDVDWVWPSAFIQNPLEEGQTMAQFARAIGNISRQTGATTPMQLTSVEEARNLIGLEGPLPESEKMPTPAEAATEEADKNRDQANAGETDDADEERDDETTDE